MSAMFERFAQMAKEDFGCIVVETSNRKEMTFESLFGVSVESITQYELPYNVLVEQVGYYDKPAVNSIFGLNHQMNIFNAEDNFAFAA